MLRTPRLALASTALALGVAGLVAAPWPAATNQPAEDEVTRSTSAEVTIRPGELARGASPEIPWVFGDTLLHGTVRADVPRDSWLLGRSGTDYLVMKPGFDTSRVVRVAPDGTRTRVVSFPATHQMRLSTDGAMLIRTAQRRADGEWRTVLGIHDPASGDVLSRRAFTGIVDVLDADGGRAVLGSWTPEKTLLWDVAAGTTRRLVRQAGYIADLRADRLGTFTDDPYLDGCAVLRRLSAPGELLSRSCAERAAAISPSGRRIATIHILSDGLGPREVSVRRDTGGKLVDYRVAGWFGRIDFESDRALLLEASGTEKQAVVRCVSADCERASRTRPRPDY